MKTSLSPYGKIFRKLRVDNDDSGEAVGRKLGVSGAVISAIDRGRCKVPRGFTEKVVKLYNLTDEQKEELLKAEEAQTQFLRMSVRNCDGEAYDILRNFLVTLESCSEITKSTLKSVFRKVCV